MCLFELLTGLPPFNADTAEEVFRSIVQRDIPWPEGEEALSDAARQAIEALLALEPSQRPVAAEFRAGTLRYFREAPWDAMDQQKMPFIPQPDSPMDTTYFAGERLVGCRAVRITKSYQDNSAAQQFLLLKKVSVNEKYLLQSLQELYYYGQPFFFLMTVLIFNFLKKKRWVSYDQGGDFELRPSPIISFSFSASRTSWPACLDWVCRVTKCQF